MEYKVVSPTPQEKLAQWGDGPWVSEPNDFEFEYKGYVCFGRRVCVWEGWNMDHLALGHWCGYILLPENHPWREMHGCENESISEIDVHGDITHRGLAHIKEGYSVGFDCGHLGDLTPSMIKIYQETEDKIPEFLKKMTQEMEEAYPDCPMFRNVYRDIEYVKQQCRNLVDQAIEAQGLQKRS